ncbi:hypothetical protein CC86DRAFT_21396 [Ophiobolus disseminans]|uniref:Uncharacterized protein n=1 Tax=Ophiobolus disseminans TaxID=1469910 RepID=A0A6A7A0L1_9PLEO|nr:hypothetical protein CC86DRAFT_21396 [Ophiobolus disseminans]
MDCFSCRGTTDRHQVRHRKRLEGRRSTRQHVPARQAPHRASLAPRLPIWGCLTGLSSNEDNPQNPFTDYMYAIRQIVALWRVDHAIWKPRAIECISICRTIERKNNISATYWRKRPDAEIVEATIGILSKAAEYQLGYKGSWLPIGRDGSEWNGDHMNMFRFVGEHRKTACQKEHAFVYAV